MFKNPGREFIEKYGYVSSKDDLSRYIDFICCEAKVSRVPPVNIEEIYNHFEIKFLTESLWDDTQGISDTNSGLVIINQEDPLVRQRFTKGHELMEFLLTEHEDLFDNKKKEHLCEWGAASLLMPRDFIISTLEEHEFSMSTASYISEKCNSSFTSSLLRIVELSSIKSAVVMFKEFYSSKERKENCKTSKKLRVKWVVRSSINQFPFIPNNCSVSEKSCIYNTYFNADYVVNIDEILMLGNFKNPCKIEAKNIYIGDEKHTISLIRLCDFTSVNNDY